MNKLPAWFPTPLAWFNALALVILTFLLLQVGQQKIISSVIEFLFHLSPQIGIVVVFLGLISPIIFIAIAHHSLHFVLDKYFPDIQVPEVERVTGLFPSLMSWWEGLYGWTIILFASLFSTMFLILFDFSFISIQQDLLETFSGNFFTIPTLIRFLVATYLYHFESLVRQHLMSVSTRR